MEKTVDLWREIGLLIGKEKERALAEFRNQKFEVTSASAVSPTGGPFWIMIRHTASLAAAASFFLAVGLALFLLLNGSWQTVPVASGLDVLLADSILYNLGRDPEVKKPESRATALFFHQFAAWGEAAGWNRVAAPVATPVDPSLPVEHGDPAAVQRKMEKVIRENSIERVLAQFCQICKEV